MSINEYKQLFGTKKYVTSTGDTLPFIARKFYKEVSYKCLSILVMLNSRIDWDNLEAGVTIEYPEDISDINVVW